MSALPVYTIWLQPRGDVAYQLQERINKLSKKYDTPSFEPHVTLISGLKRSETEMKALLNTLAASVSPFELTLSKAGYQDTFYQSLFIYVQKNKILDELRKRSCRLFDCSEENSYSPHLSLLYGDLSQNEKERILNTIGREFYIPFSVKSLVLMRTDGEPGHWEKREAAVFKG